MDKRAEITDHTERHATLLSMFPRASGDFLAANPVQVNVERKQPYGETINNGKIPHPFPQSALCNESVAATKGKNRNPERCLVRITSFRCRLTDPDNLCPKYFIDSLRYAGAIPDDRQEDIILETRQEKVKSYAEEKTVIMIEK